MNEIKRREFTSQSRQDRPGAYRILLCIMRTHVFMCIIHGIIMPIIICPWYVIVIPMYNAHPYFYLKIWGKKAK